MKIVAHLFWLFLLVWNVSYYPVLFGQGNSGYLITNSILLLVLTYVNISNNGKGLFLNFYLFFVILFFSIVPSRDLSISNTYWGAVYPDDIYLFFTNILIIIFTLLYYLFHSYGLKCSTVRPPIRVVRKLNYLNLFVISILSFVIFLYFFDLQVQKLFFRKYSTLSTSGHDRWVHLLLNYFVRPIPLISLMFLSYYATVNRKTVVWFLLISLISVLSVFPIALPRFIVGSLYFPLIVLLFRIRTSENIYLLFSFLFLSAFTFLGSFRGDSGFSLRVLKFELSTSGAFDAYFTFSHVVYRDLVTYGEQLLGVIFFMIPRVFWTSKPIGSGAKLAKLSNFNFSNISMPLIGEGYINFGVIGVILFAVTLGMVTGKADRSFIYRKNELHFKHPVFTLIASMIFFFSLRGDLMTSYSYFVCILFSYFLVRFLALKRI